MLALYPSNKLEHLSFLLTALIKQQPNRVFTPETILVESPGMQHWVSMQLANAQGIAMNLDFPLPVRFMWNTARTILGSDKVPKQSPYRREVLTWRIDALLQDTSLQLTPEFQQVNQYWLHAKGEQEQGVQRLQLATALADVYEQYLLYRPDWLFAWEENKRVTTDEMELWQSEIWRQLVQQAPLHPARLHQMTIAALQAGNVPSNLPSRVVVFAINTMAPQLIAFFDALANHIDIHIFHLNPSVNYWGDAKSDSELARQLRIEGLEKWMQQEQSNPLLGNLGKQGRELFNLLTELDTFEVSAFDAPPIDDDSGDSVLLNAVQRDILHASPATPLCHDENTNDDSVVVMCSHSALREVQVLHDHLLHWLSQDSTRTPSDILVMCPAIENYAPFVDAVFHRVGTKPIAGSKSVRLPCSIADRCPMDAEPLIAAFMALLHLPDSRFGVSDIVDYLQLEAVQKRFDIASDDIEQMTVWLQQAHIHWGLDSEHKAMVSSGVTDDAMYSWWWGLRRLLRGMLAPDSEMVVDDLLTIPDVEGQASIVLGKLIQVIELLSEFSKALNTARTPSEWAKTLLTLRNRCFIPAKEQEHSWDLIAKVIADLAARCEEANYTYELTLRQVRELLLNRFSSPDTGNHFMTGQVTVCSMLPMRSIPFKKVCILGLNDSEFPRKSTPLGLDLMAGPERRMGDRSRRLEDRYLFLEAIISARESLYLSYQGNDVKNNSERQPSLVLAEFLDMLKFGYGVDLARYVKQAPLHPFSETAFTGAVPSYDTGWLRLAQSLQDEAIKRHSKQQDESHNELTPITIDIDNLVDSEHYSCKQVASAFRDPLAYFSHQRLGISLSQSSILLENSEPFETNALTRYQVLDAIFAPSLEGTNDVITEHSERVVQFASLRGDIPNNPVAQQELMRWKEGAVALTQAMGPYDSELKRASYTGKHFTFTATAHESADSLVQLCAGAITGVRALEYFITQLVFCSSDQVSHYSGYPLTIYYCSWKKDETTLNKYVYPPIEQQTAIRVLQLIERLFLSVYTTPTPVYASLLNTLIGGKKKSSAAALASKITVQCIAKCSDDEFTSLVENVTETPCLANNNDEMSVLIQEITQFLDTSEARNVIENWQQSSGKYDDNMANNPYLKWLFPDGIKWQDMPAVCAFLVFSLVANSASEEQL